MNNSGMCCFRSYIHTKEMMDCYQIIVMVVNSKTIPYFPSTRLLFRFFYIMMKLKLLIHWEARQENIS